MNFFALRWDAYKAAKKDVGSRKILSWDVGRVLVWMMFFTVRLVAHDLFTAGDSTKPMRFMIAITTFGTFLASFVLSVMTTTGKRELSSMRDATSVRLMKERLRWLMSDQLIMVVSALLAAALSLMWLGVVSADLCPPRLLTASVLAFGALAVFNALRLPFHVWELQSSALEEEQRRAIQRLNSEVDKMFKE